jgi:hypothetical protein
MVEKIKSGSPDESGNFRQGQIPGVELPTPETQKDCGLLQAGCQGEARENQMPLLSK